MSWSSTDPNPEAIAALVAPQAVTLGSEGAAAALAAWQARVLGAGPLEPLLEDELVTDILVNGTEGVWVERGSGLQRTEVTLGEPADVRRLAVRLAGLAGRRLDDSSPFVDGLLPGGARLHAILPPLVPGAAHISLRVPRRRSPDLGQLTAWGAMDAGVESVLRQIVQARVAALITGGTGTGKTTLLGALLHEVPATERIVLVEDVAELQVSHPHCVGLQGRPPNVEGQGEVDLVTLVRQALRMRPDRLVLGEVRGAEVRELLAALNTGHEGGLGTVHANSVPDVVARVEALGALAQMSPPAVRSQLVSGVQAVVHLRRRQGQRIVDAVGVLHRAGEHLEVLPAVERAGDGYRRGAGWTALEAVLEASS